MDKQALLEKVIVNAYSQYVAHTPNYYYFVMVVSWIVCLLFVLSLLFKRGLPNVSLTLMCCFSVWTLLFWDRPNLRYYYGNEIHAVLQSEVIEYNRCVIDSQAFKLMKWVGAEKYARAKAQNLLESVKSGKDFRCGGVLRFDNGPIILE